jgi:hypothetical protein
MVQKVSTYFVFGLFAFALDDGYWTAPLCIFEVVTTFVERRKHTIKGPKLHHIASAVFIS